MIKLIIGFGLMALVMVLAFFMSRVFDLGDVWALIFVIVGFVMLPAEYDPAVIIKKWLEKGRSSNDDN